MAMTSDPTLAPRYEAELTAYVAACAEADAVRVGEFPRQYGIAPPPGQTLKVSAAHLLEFGAAMRMLALEEAGLDIHRQVGLPAAREALAETLLAPTRAGKRQDEVDSNPALLPTVLRLLVDRMAWSGPRCLGAEGVDSAQLDLEDVPVQEQEGIKRLVLGVRPDGPVGGQVGEECLDPAFPHIFGVPPPGGAFVKPDEPLDPVDVGTLGLVRVMSDPDGLSHLIE